MNPNLKPQGSGSLWNPNSWHWEEKDYTNIAKQIIDRNINSVKVTSSDITINISSKTIKGEAQVNIRKGKQILNYDFDIDVEWKGENESDEAEGTFKIKDFNCLDPDLEFIGLVAKQKTIISDKCKDIVKKEIYPLIKKNFKNFTQELAQFESNPDKMQFYIKNTSSNQKQISAEDQQKRQQVELLAQQAYEQNGQAKELIFEQQKQKEQQLKAQFSQWSDKPQN